MNVKIFIRNITFFFSYLLLAISIEAFATTTPTYQNTLDINIPDNSSSGATRTLLINDSGVPNSARITNLAYGLLINHTWLSDLKVTLTSPSGKTLTIWNNEGSITDENADDDTENDADIFLTRTTSFFNDDLIKSGNWTVKAVDSASGDVGVISTIALQFQYTDTPDLTISSFNLNKTNFVVGESITVSATVKNIGLGSSSSSTLKYYASTNSTITASDTEIGTDAVPSLSPNGTSNESLTKTFAEPTTSAYIGVCVDSVANESITSNNCSTGIQVTVTALAPVVSSVTPTTALINTLTTFVIAGTNFTTQTAYQIQGADCPNKRFISASRLEMDCRHNIATTLEYSVVVVTQGADAGGNSRGNIIFTNPPPVNLPTILEDSVRMEESGIPGSDFTFIVPLSGTLPAGYGIFINFDDLRGNWFIQNTPGGHINVPDLTGTTYKLNRSLDKLGLRTFRVGIFNTQNDQDTTNDVLAGSWSKNYTCTLDLCLSTVVRHDDFGNPSLHGSQLFKQVDIASGNYHFVTSDMSVSGKGPSFSMTRAYNSMGVTRNGTPAPWSFSYEMKASFEGSGAAKELVIGPREDGRLQYFFKDFVTKKWTALNPGNFDQIEQNADGSITLYTQGNRLYHFSNPEGAEAGHLQSIKDRLDNALTFNYTSNNLTGVTDANAHHYTITRDGSNRIQRVTDFAQRYVEYSYDSNNMITNVRNMRGGNETYSYVNGSNLSGITDPRTNLQATIAYDANGRVANLTNGVGNITEFLYGIAYPGGPLATGVKQPKIGTTNHNRVYVVDNDRTRVEEMVDAVTYGTAFQSTDIRTKQEYLAVASRQHLPEKALVTRVTNPKNGTTDIVYSASAVGRPSTVTDAENRTSSASYTTVANQTNLMPLATAQQAGVAAATQYQQFTETGRSKTITDPLNHTSTREFSGPAGALTKSTNPRLFSTNYTYDALGNIKIITDAKGGQTNYDLYDALGRVTKETSPLGLVTTYTYDAHGNVLTQRDQATGINYLTQYAYDASDNLTKTTNPKGQSTNYVYDVVNRKTEENYLVNGVLHTRRYAYDAMGRMASVTNERNQTSVTHYDARSQVQSKVNALGDTTVTYSYDANGNVETVTDAEQRTITTIYDKINRKTQVTDDKNQTEHWVYNTAGQVETHTDKRGEVTQYEYDAVGNLKKMYYPNHPELGFTQSNYDKNNNVIEVLDPKDHKTTYTYDELDRRTSTILHNGQTWQYTYDANGNQLTETTPTGEWTKQVYDALNRVTELTEYAANNSITRQISYSYDANSNVSSESSGGNSISYSYDALNRVSSITDVYGKTISYAYDKAGNRTGLTYPGNKTLNYVYDNADHLKSLTDWLNKTTTYNRNKAGQTENVVNGNGTKTEYVYDTVGRLTSLKNLKANGTEISRHDLTLDEAGNITQATVNLPLTPTLPQSIASMSYDNNNRLQSADGNSYTHDLSGRIIREDQTGVQTIYNFDINDHISSITRNGTSLSSYGYDLNDNRIKQVQNGVETRYVIDPLAALPNVVAETNAAGVVSRYYIYGEGLVSQIDAAGLSHYYHYDPTGHTLALTDASGNVTDKYAYAPYGLTTVDGATPNPFKYVGRHGVMDDGNGLHYMRARYYSEEIKRFVSLDGLHGDVLNPQSLNRYAYVLGNPVSNIDPSGLSSKLSKAEVQAKIKKIRLKLRIAKIKARIQEKKDLQAVRSSWTVVPDAVVAAVPKNINGAVSTSYSYVSGGGNQVIKGIVTTTLCNETLDIVVALYDGERLENNVQNVHETCSIISDATNPGYVSFTYGKHVYKIYDKGFVGAGEHELSKRLENWNNEVKKSSTFNDFVNNSEGNQAVKNAAKQNAAAGIVYGTVSRLYGTFVRIIR